jgi:hypothetical protein
MGYGVRFNGHTVTTIDPINISVKTSAKCTPLLVFVASLCRRIASVVIKISGPHKSHCVKSVDDGRGISA